VRGRLELATEAAERAVALDPSARSYVVRAAVAEQRPDDASARADLDRAVALDPGYAPGWARRARLRTKSDPAGAASDIARARVLAADDSLVLSISAEIRGGDGDDEGALADLTKVIAKSARYRHRSLYIRATILGRQGRLTEALADLDRAVEVKGSDLATRSYRAALLVGRAEPADLERAVIDLGAILERRPRDVEALRQLAYVRCLQDDPGALGALEALFAVAPDDAAGLMFRGELFARHGDVAAARADLERAAASVDPQVGPRARSFLEQLGR
jgi:tetratricopeptide (TPR) repeat protein